MIVAMNCVDLPCLHCYLRGTERKTQQTYAVNIELIINEYIH